MRHFDQKDKMKVKIINQPKNKDTNIHMTNLVIWSRIERRLIYRRILRRIHGLTHRRIWSLVSWRILRWIRTGVSVVLWGVV